MDADQEDQVGEQQADREAGLDDAGEFALGFPGGVFVGHQDRAAPFGAVGEALDDADQDEQDTGPDADALVGGQQADQEGGQAHHDQAGDENRFTADLVAEVTADDAAERADRKPTPRVAKDSRVPVSGSPAGEEVRC